MARGPENESSNDDGLGSQNISEHIDTDPFRQVVGRLLREFRLTEPHARVVAELANLGGVAS